MKRLLLLFAVAISAVALRAELKYFDAVVTEPGQLATVLGDNATVIDSLVVKGPINDSDFKTIRESIFKGKLRIVNLEKAVPENNAIPEFAFYDKEMQTEGMETRGLQLNKIILPVNLESIKDGAFFYTQMEEINIPGTVTSIGAGAFSMSNLKSVEIPDGITTIEQDCFKNCFCLESVKLPSGLKEIKSGGFYQTVLKSISLPEGLEAIGDEAFRGEPYLESIELPGSVKSIGENTFIASSGLKSITIGEGIESIPYAFAAACFNLERVSIAKTVTEIGQNAFGQCSKLKEIEIPEGVKSIDLGAFFDCGFTSIILPSTVLYLGKNSFDISTLKEIYCKAAFAPLCGGNEEINLGGTPFGAISVETPIYIPIGSKANYQATAGWNRFTNFIETNDFSGVASADLPASRAYWKDGSLVVECAGADVEKCEIYTLDGRLAASVSIGMEATEVALPRGSYIVRMGNEVLKIK